jgi:hypothetical protein
VLALPLQHCLGRPFLPPPPLLPPFVDNLPFLVLAAIPAPGLSPAPGLHQDSARTVPAGPGLPWAQGCLHANPKELAFDKYMLSGTQRRKGILSVSQLGYSDFTRVGPCKVLGTPRWHSIFFIFIRV